MRILNMKYYLSFLAILVVVHCELTPGFRARYGRGGTEVIDNTAFFDLPQNVTEAVNFGWTKQTRPEGPLSCLIMYCPRHPVVCILFDDNGFAAGVQIAIDKSRITGQVFDWTSQGFVTWTTENGTEYWTQHQYFVDEEYLAKSKEDRLASRDPNNVLQLDSIWVTGQYGKLHRIPRSRQEIEDSIFTEQACYEKMGVHHFYNMTESIQCVSEEIFPWFVTTDTKTLIGSVGATVGAYAVPEGERDWFDVKGGEQVLKKIIPHGPDCFHKLDVLTVHIYFVEEPWIINCPVQ